MEEFNENPTREEVIAAIQEHDPEEDLNTMSVFNRYLMSEVARFDLAGTESGRIYFDIKKAELFFDAGEKGRAIKVLEEANKKAAETGQIDIFKSFSRELRRKIDNM